VIVKKLRVKNGWSQEQLATFSGLNVRTVQRVESGNKASVETLKSLASVFEVDIATLTEEITVIDKSLEDWKRRPWWFRANMFGINNRKHVFIIEMVLLCFGLMHWIVRPDIFGTPMIFLAAYATGWLLRYGDKHAVWQD